ncbi:ribose-5-phosphate isomerase RpiA [Sporolactobacillus sp. THM19-2]|jgi:ribose 5-phosphate isomerase A|uniref:ribose-5-phosphate isomerase RpiA n=1 Tax=Sporolactobacillus sp. THM19-2 TaxID=2511171 RepID=UPI00101FA263|nr:ribose-5-phosphate isomerase RpiA [Sporolactobacillus sp. THM19-2]RYL87550.1 ribose-5-phosphate isomerase RpiA [Sporolactobacillus sp. THM19-2]
MNGKQAAGYQAVDEIHNGMTVGLGTGSTVYFFLEALAQKVASGLSVTGVATSQKTIDLAENWKIPMESLNDVDRIDLTVDGADEVDQCMNGIKGGGGALLYEKMVAQASDKRLWIVDSRKKVQQLGAFPLPIEVIPFGWKQIEKMMQEKGCHPQLRLNTDGTPFETDAHHYILDLHLGKIDDPEALADELDHVTGVVEHGLFIHMTDKTLIGYPDGHVETMERKK